LILTLLVVAIVSGPPTKGGGGQESAEGERKTSSKNKSGFDNVEVAVGEPAELDDRILTVAEVERPYRPGDRFRKADRGKEFLRVWVHFRNTGSQSVSYSLLSEPVMPLSQTCCLPRARSGLTLHLPSGRELTSRR
jgi:hypothetical protein